MISLIVPVYNAEQFLLELLASVAVQTYRDFEAIFVDDGSTDASGKVLDKWCERHSEGRVVHIANGGVSHARNVGLEHARSEWIAFADADDVLLPGYLQSLISSADADVVVSGFLLDFDGSIKHNRLNPSFAAGHHGVVCEFERQHLTGQGFAFGKLYRSSIIRDNGLRFDERISRSEDLLFLMQAVGHASSMRIVDSEEYVYKVRTGGNHLLSRPVEWDAEMLNIKLRRESYRKYFSEHANGSILSALMWDSMRNLLRTIMRSGVYSDLQMRKKALAELCRACPEAFRDDDYWFSSKLAIAQYVLLKMHLYGLYVRLTEWRTR